MPKPSSLPMFRTVMLVGFLFSSTSSPPRFTSDYCAVEQLVLELLRRNEYVEFLVGRDGEFDLLVASTIRRCKRTYRNDNSALIWVMPYETAEYRDNREAYDDYYDEVEVCSESAGKHFKAAHQIRNRAMIDRSDLAVFCVLYSRKF